MDAHETGKTKVTPHVKVFHVNPRNDNLFSEPQVNIRWKAAKLGDYTAPPSCSAAVIFTFPNDRWYSLPLRWPSRQYMPVKAQNFRIHELVRISSVCFLSLPPPACITPASSLNYCHLLLHLRISSRGNANEASFLHSFLLWFVIFFFSPQRDPILTFGVETEVFTSFEEQCVWYIRLGLRLLAWNDMTISRLESVYAWWDVWKKALFIKKYEYGILMASCERDAVLYTRSFLGWTRWLSVYWEYRIMPI